MTKQNNRRGGGGGGGAMKEGNVVVFLFNDALNTFYLRLYGVRHMVKDHSDSEFPLSLFEWSFTICLTPYNRK